MTLQEYIKTLIQYDPDIGKVIRLKNDNPKSNKNIGKEIKSKVITVRGKKMYLHRVLWIYMTGEDPSEQIGFKDGNVNNLKFNNLYKIKYSKKPKQRVLFQTYIKDGIKYGICTKCNEHKELNTINFQPRKDSTSGFRGTCRECLNKAKKEYRNSNRGNYTYRSSEYIRKYGITYDEYIKMLEKQNYKCKICGNTDPDISGKIKHFHIDHDHKTGKVRGLLCDKCNRGLGMFNDDITLLQQAITYLKDNNEL